MPEAALFDRFTKPFARHREDFPIDDNSRWIDYEGDTDFMLLPCIRVMPVRDHFGLLLLSCASVVRHQSQSVLVTTLGRTTVDVNL